MQQDTLLHFWLLFMEINAMEHKIKIFLFTCRNFYNFYSYRKLWFWAQESPFFVKKDNVQCTKNEHQRWFFKHKLKFYQDCLQAFTETMLNDKWVRKCWETQWEKIVDKSKVTKLMRYVYMFFSLDQPVTKN